MAGCQLRTGGLALMFDIERFINTDALFDGHYRMLRPLSTDEGPENVWLAIDVSTIEGYSTNDGHVIDESSGTLVVIKIYRPKNTFDDEDAQRFGNEFKMANKCRHANLLQPTSFSIYDGIPYLVLPYCEKGSVKQFVGEEKPNSEIWHLVHDVAAGLNVLHTNQPPIIHQSIKPSNILINDDGDFVLTDFGIGALKPAGKPSVFEDRSPRSKAYMAPEYFGKSATPVPESDIWSFGATLYEILTGSVPFGEKGGMRQLVDKDPTLDFKGMHPDFRNLIKSCLQADPKQRPTARQIVESAQTKRAVKNKKKASGNEGSNKKRIIAIAAAAIALVGVLIGILTPHHDDTILPVEPEKTVTIDPYDVAVRLLSETDAAESGLNMLDSLADARDWRATFLLSRLYFDTRGNDTVFYDKLWATMQSLCGIVANNDTAHRYLLDAFELNENDFMILYQLGCDFLAGMVRGCDRNLNYALWCFNHAETALNGSDPNNTLYRQEIDNMRGRISTDKYPPIKPQR